MEKDREREWDKVFHGSHFTFWEILLSTLATESITLTGFSQIQNQLWKSQAMLNPNLRKQLHSTQLKGTTSEILL